MLNLAMRYIWHHNVTSYDMWPRKALKKLEYAEARLQIVGKKFRKESRKYTKIKTAKKSEEGGDLRQHPSLNKKKVANNENPYQEPS